MIEASTERVCKHKHDTACKPVTTWVVYGPGGLEITDIKTKAEAAEIDRMYREGVAAAKAAIRIAKQSFMSYRAIGGRKVKPSELRNMWSVAQDDD